MVGPGGWTTVMNVQHDTEWHPPPRLDTGQNRVNHYHHPERFRMPSDDTWTPDVPATGSRRRSSRTHPSPRDAMAKRSRGCDSSGKRALGAF
jgi:hypothetical protein